MHHADHWRSIVGQSDEQVIDLIQNDQINILVDLTNHTNENTNTFAHKPAPVQVTCSAIRTQQGSMPSIIASLTTTLPILSAKPATSIPNSWSDYLRGHVVL